MKYFKQETDYTCAIACLRMVLSTVMEDVPSEEELAIKLKSNELHGTNPHEIVDYLNSSAPFYAKYIENGTIDDIREELKYGNLIILLISVDVPHCVIYLNDNNNHMFVHDPYFGENKAYVLKKFLSSRTNYPSARWSTDLKSVEKHHPDIDFAELKKFEGKGQYIVIQK